MSGVIRVVGVIRAIRVLPEVHQGAVGKLGLERVSNLKLGTGFRVFRV